MNSDTKNGIHKGEQQPAAQVAAPDNQDSRPEVTQRVYRGACKHLAAHDFQWCPEFRVNSGRRLDMLGVSVKGLLWTIEIKSSVEDYRVDTKWQEYLEFCDQFSFAVSPEFPTDILPPDVGIVVTDGYEHFQKRKPMKTSGLSGPARKALLIRFGRVMARRSHYLSQQLLALGGGDHLGTNFDVYPDL